MIIKKLFSVGEGFCGDATCSNIHLCCGDVKNPFSTNFHHNNPSVKFNFCACFFFVARLFMSHKHSRENSFSRFFNFPTFFYLPDVSFSCSTKSLPVMSATESESMFANNSRSGSLSIEMLQRFVFICPTSFFS